MKYKLPVLILCLCTLMFTQGCVLANEADSKMKESTYTLLDFTSINTGMTYDEVIKILGEPTDSSGAGIVWQRYKLYDGWYVELLFMGESEALVDMHITDYVNNREFELKQNKE